MDCVLGTLMFGAFVFLAIAFSESERAPGACTNGLKTSAVRMGLCALAGIAGGIMLAERTPPETIVAMAAVCTGLACTCAIAARGVALGPFVPASALAVMLFGALIVGDLGPFVSAFALALPFAATALLVREAAADWQDPIVAALGGGMFGLQFGLELTCIATVVTIVARLMRSRARAAQPASNRFSAALSATFLVALVGKLAIS